MLVVFSWKPALEMWRYVKTQIFLLLKACHFTQIVAENLTNSTKSGICRHLRYKESLIRKPYCTYFAMYQRNKNTIFSTKYRI